MPRVTAAARNARIALALSSARTRNSETNDLAYTYTTLYPCPYCHRVLKSDGNRTKHVGLSPACSASHNRVVRAQIASRHAQRVARDRASAAQEAGRVAAGEPDIELEDEDHAAAAQGIIDEDIAANTLYPPISVSPGPPPSPPRSSSPPRSTTPSSMDSGRGPGRYYPATPGAGPSNWCREPVVDKFPSESAGAPINEDRAMPDDLHAYMRARAPFANPAHFEVAELLMTSGMGSGTRERHLKSRKVSREPLETRDT